MAHVGQVHAQADRQVIQLLVLWSEARDGVLEPLPGALAQMGHPMKKDVPGHLRCALSLRLISLAVLT